MNNENKRCKNCGKCKKSEKKLDDVFKGEIDKIFVVSIPPRAGKSLNSFDTYQIIDTLKELRYIINEQKIAIDEIIDDYKKLEKENMYLKKKN